MKSGAIYVSGSSSIKSSGLDTIALANKALCICPPLKAPMWMSATLSSSRTLNSLSTSCPFSTRLPIKEGDKVVNPETTSSLTDIGNCLSIIFCWGRYPISSDFTFSPPRKYSTSPFKGLFIPSIILSNVVLPPPFGPTTPRHDLSEISRFISLKITLSPYPAVMLFSLNIVCIFIISYLSIANIRYPVTSCQPFCLRCLSHILAANF